MRNAYKRSRLVELLAEQLQWALKNHDDPLFHSTWKTLWAMGAQALVLEPQEVFIVSAKPT
jgi:hypothetical protein